jgi:ribokinase
VILVFGSLNMDLALTVERLPKPGETVLGPSYVLTPGGKGANQAVAAARSGGADTRMVGTIGDDEFGRMALTALQRHGVDVSGIRNGTKPTGCAAILVATDAENLIGVASGANLETKAADVPIDRLGTGTTLLLQMEVPADEIWALAKQAKARGTRVVLNLAPARPVPPSSLKDLDVLICNEHEAQILAESLGIPAGRDATQLIGALAKGLGLTFVVTLGAKGAMTASPTERWFVDALPITPVDTTGAGDAFCGVFAAALDRRLPIQAALERANVAGALACMAVGAQEALPRRQVIEEKLLTSPRAYKGA